MKKNIYKTIFIIQLLFIFNCKAQKSIYDYIIFYNDVVPKLNLIVPYKTQFYNQNFSTFYNELKNKNIVVKSIGIDSKEANSPKDYVLVLYFSEDSKIAFDYEYQYPVVWIDFQEEIPKTVKDIMRSYYGDWNETVAQQFLNMKIEKIEFVGINGYNNPDRTIK